MQLGINYKNLSEKEFLWLIQILQKSKKMGTPFSQRKKRKSSAAESLKIRLCGT